MLFKIKNHLMLTLLVTALFVATSLALKRALGLEWNLAFEPNTLRNIAIGIATIGASDGILHISLLLILRRKYLDRHEELAEYFRPQGALEILAGGVMASSEELLFRGVFIQATLAVIGAPAALAITAVIFGLVHMIPARPRLRIYTIWAIWEGALLGGVFLWSGSLLVSLIVHGVHDVAGFTVFAIQRHYTDKRKNV